MVFGRGGKAPKVFIRTPRFDGKNNKGTRAGALGATMAKKVHYRIDPNDESITLKDIMAKIQEIQRQHPDLDVFFDGDEYAICSRPKKE
jgi:hypothetical protein